MRELLLRLWKEEESQDLVEYALLLFLVALGAIVGMGKLATAVNTAYSSAAKNLTIRRGGSGE